jgi:hypothetical protein
MLAILNVVYGNETLERGCVFEKPALSKEPNFCIRNGEDYRTPLLKGLKVSVL